MDLFVLELDFCKESNRKRSDQPLLQYYITEVMSEGSRVVI